MPPKQKPTEPKPGAPLERFEQRRVIGADSHISDRGRPLDMLITHLDLATS